MSQPLPPPEWRDADPAALRDAVTAAGGGGEPPGPSLAEYAADLALWLRSRFADALGRSLPGADVGQLELFVTYAAIFVALSALAVLAVVLVRQLRRRRGGVAGPSATSEQLAPAPPPLAAHDAEWWWGEAGRLLEAGAPRQAAGALWWWAARRLDPPGLDATWTTGQLLRRSGATTLRGPLRRLDALLWGAAAPHGEQVGELRGELRVRLAETYGGAAVGPPREAAAGMARGPLR
jgi:hypothetical protein